ncbi:hypothetical protein F5B19DRAFT_502940 [Rostrohypoxylon terebratum]|nr:hypothetical protein F5B19DRAFT_502940 [Rostrohypoxylon terebratum]
MWVDEIENSPLSTRGWVVQERFLSRRTVYFTRNQAYWECLGCYRCEADISLSLQGHPGISSRQPEMRQLLDFGYKAAKLGIAKAKAHAKAGQPYNEKIIIFFWITILSTYLSCTLTKDSDRLVAMSGIAKVFREVNQDTYLAGLWKRSIQYGFLWKTEATSGTWIRRNESYGPSWSWASVMFIGTGLASKSASLNGSIK